MNKKTEEMRERIKHRRQKYAAGELGPIEMNIEDGLKNLAVDWAEKVINDIEAAINDPEKSLKRGRFLILCLLMSTKNLLVNGLAMPRFTFRCLQWINIVN